ncbi:MAG: hypothetical protein ACRDTK_02180 [Mycobacterium sp.]
MARSAALIQALEVGTARMAGHHPTLEGAAVTWQAGQYQPDALTALVVAMMSWSTRRWRGALRQSARRRPPRAPGPDAAAPPWMRRRIGR